MQIPVQATEQSVPGPNLLYTCFFYLTAYILSLSIIQLITVPHVHEQKLKVGTS